MAELHITAYRQMARDATGTPLPAPMEPNLGYQAVEISALPEQSKKLPRFTFFVVLVADEDCMVSFGEAPSFPVFTGERVLVGTEGGVTITVGGI
jgi:hypothetical protein